MDTDKIHDIVFGQNCGVVVALRQLIIRKHGTELDIGYLWWGYVGNSSDKWCGLCDQQFRGVGTYEAMAEHAMQHLREHNLLALI